MVLHTLVFTILPVATELGTIVIVLTRLRQPAFLVLFCGALVFYALAFAYARDDHHTRSTARFGRPSRFECRDDRHRH